MNIDEYIKKCGRSNIDELTDDELVSFFLPPINVFIFSSDVMEALKHKDSIGMFKIVSCLKRAIKQKKNFYCYRVECGDGDSYTPSYFKVGTR